MEWYPVPWKRNLLKTPKGILEKVRVFKGDTCVASCAKRIPLAEIKKGTYAHLGICWTRKGLRFEPRVMPLPEMGKYSRENVEGKEIVRKEDGLEKYFTSIDTPNYGDWDNGSHTVDLPYWKYPRDFIGPKLTEIKIEHIAFDENKQAHVFKFTVDEVLRRSKRGFKDKLLVNLNLLQENTGNHDVFESTATIDDYLKTLYVNWEILPPGERDKNLKRILSNIKSKDPKVREKLVERYDYLLNLKPKDIVLGTNGFRNYFGARFADDIVVFENVDYGNAIYIMFEEWQKLSKKSRTEVLSGRAGKFVRILHTEAWKLRLRKAINSALQPSKGKNQRRGEPHSTSRNLRRKKSSIPTKSRSSRR